MRMKTLLSLAIPAWLFICVSFPVPAPAEIPDYIAKAPGLKEYPNEDGLILKQEVTITLEKDGKVKRHYLFAQKVLGEYMMRARQCDPAITYDAKDQELTIMEARTYMADGTAVDTGKNGFNEITPHALECCPAYTNLRQMVVTFVGTEHFATNVLEYEINDKEPSGLPWVQEIELQADKPILEQKVTLIVPADKKLTYQVLGAAIEPSVDNQRGAVVYRFSRKKVPGINIQEQPKKDEYADALIATTCESWGRALKSIHAGDALDSSSQIKSKVEELTREALSPDAKLTAIHDFVVNGIAAVNWPLADFHFRPRPASEIFLTSYGHVLDKAVLLAAMLKEAGFKPEIVLVSPSLRFDETVPALTQLDDAWVLVRLEAKTVYLHPNAPRKARSRIDLAGHALLPLSSGEGTPERLEAARDDASLTSLSGRLKLEKGEGALTVSGSLQVDLKGKYNPLRESSQSSDELQKLADRIAKTFYGAKASKFQLVDKSADRTSMTIDIEAGKVTVKDNVPIILAIPLPEGSTAGDRSLQIYRKSRTTFLFVPAPLEERVSLEIECGSVKPIGIPPDKSLETEIGALFLHAESNDGTVRIERRLTVSTPVIEPSRYGMFREFITSLLSERNSVVVLENGK